MCYFRNKVVDRQRLLFRISTTGSSNDLNENSENAIFPVHTRNKCNWNEGKDFWKRRENMFVSQGNEGRRSDYSNPGSIDGNREK